MQGEPQCQPGAGSTGKEEILKKDGRRIKLWEMGTTSTVGELSTTKSTVVSPHTSRPHLHEPGQSCSAYPSLPMVWLPECRFSIWNERSAVLGTVQHVVQQMFLQALRKVETLPTVSVPKRQTRSSDVALT
jgi:hypothetical protein